MIKLGCIILGVNCNNTTSSNSSIKLPIKGPLANTMLLIHITIIMFSNDIQMLPEILTHVILMIEDNNNNTVLLWLYHKPISKQ